MRIRIRNNVFFYSSTVMCAFQWYCLVIHSSYLHLQYTHGTSTAVFRSTGSTCFWASRIRIHQSDEWIRIRILLWIRILLSSCKISKKNLDSYYFVALFDFLSLKNYVNVPLKVISRKIVLKISFFAGILKVNDKNSRIRIRIHQSEAWIRGSGSTPKFLGSGTLLHSAYE